MIVQYLGDLDELILLCKDNKARIYIAEAVACYRAGAFRSCIVAIWNAVVFDFINKLRQLDLTGDARAKSRLEEFENLRSTHNLDKLLKFEKNVLQMASGLSGVIGQ